MVCSRCKKRPAIIMVGNVENGEPKQELLCIQCAKELGIKDVDKALEKMGITEEMIDQMENAFEELGDSEELESLTQTMPAFSDFFSNFKSSFGSGSSENKDDVKKDEKSKNKKEKKEKAKPKYKILNGFCVNLNEKAKQGKIDNLIGRDREIKRVMQILCRRQKNNPCLIGEPGVGKTAIAEGLALAIENKKVPAKLLDKEIYLVDLTALVAGTQFRGQFENRIKGLIEDVTNKGNVILVIDEVHNIVGVGDSEGSMNAANILKPALSRGEIQVIGATTFAEYRKHIEKDSALERRFQPVTIEEPTIDQTIDILKGIKNYYEDYHLVIIEDSIIETAVKMSERYITDRFLPDKAIDLLDEACSNISINDKNLNDLYTSKKEYEKLQVELADLEENVAQLDDKDETKSEIYQQIATLKSKELQLKSKIDEVSTIPRPILRIKDLSKVIEIWTGIPADKTEKNDLRQLSGLKKEIQQVVLGQDEAVESVCSAVLRNRVGLSPVKRPVSFIFVGPTGVGKTYLVKTLADKLFDNVDSLIRLDMSEFMEKHSVSRIIGSPPGYVGYDEAGQLTEKIRRKPYSVILFDEIEKAHPDVLNILLQILDDGHITDSHGRKVDFSNTVIVLTSNAGSEEKSDIAGFNREKKVIAKEKATKALSQFLRPEFINRIDEIIVFNPLTNNDIFGISKIMTDELKLSLNQRGIDFICNDDVIKYVGEKSNYNKFGARDLRRVIQKEIEDTIAKKIVENIDLGISKVSCQLVDGKIDISVEK